MILFTTKADSQQLVIGGQSTFAGGDDGGLLGPFPRYSMSSENLFTPNGTYINTKFTINVTGTAVLNKADANQNILVAGERQSRVQGEALTILQFGRGAAKTQRVGRLEIKPYGGINTNTIKFEDAIITSIEIPEQTEESSGIQNLEYSFTFEAFQDESVNSNASKTTAESADLDYNVQTAEESWELVQNDGQFTYFENDPELLKDIRKTYTLTHTLSAVGVKRFTSEGQMQQDDEAFRQASLWVASRLVTDPMQAITKDMFGDQTQFPSQFIPADMNDPEKTTELGFNLSQTEASGGQDVSTYKGFNHVRQVSHDTAAGSYSVTDTWLLSPEDLSATHNIEFSFESTPDATASVINVNVTVTGLATKTSLDQNDNKYEGALASFTVLKENLFEAAKKVYVDSGGQFNLRDFKTSESVSHDKPAGTITYSTAYTDLEVKYDPPEQIISENISINYGNDEGAIQNIVIHPVLLREAGPIIQDMTTTPEKTVTVTYDLIMARNFRVTKPPSANTMAVIELYLPETTADGFGPFITEKSETFSPSTGAYSLSITYTYV